MSGRVTALVITVKSNVETKVLSEIVIIAEAKHVDIVAWLGRTD